MSIEMAFYCPVHQVRFHAAPEKIIQCDRASHALGYGFPDESIWGYCCACATFWPYESSSHDSQLTACPVCEREVGKRCLCRTCKVITIEAKALIHKKTHSIAGGGVTPSCPGCRALPAKKMQQHDCPELGLSFLTARAKCEFCDVQLSTDGLVCPSCGTALRPPYKFCAKCGTAPHESGKEITHQEHQAVDLKATIVESMVQPVNEYQPVSANSLDYKAQPKPTKPRTPWVIGGAAGLLLVAILVVVAVTNSSRTPPTPDRPVIPTPPAGMVYIPGGEFLMGSNTGDEYERPAHKVSVAPFFMDITEVTCEQFSKFLKETKRSNPRGWTSQTCGPAAPRQPVTGVDWIDARSYAEWIKKRLPTEAEWEFAARGISGGSYPWGNDWRSNAANAGQSSAHRLMDVASYPNGKTATGLMDLIGNVWEWTSSDLVAYPGGSLSISIPPDVKVIRGGSWRQSNEQATATYRGYLHTTDAEDYSLTGFRCVRDVPSTAAQR